MLYVPAVAALFKYKIVSSIIILACGNTFDQMRLVRQLSQHGVGATVACDPAILDLVPRRLQGVLRVTQPNDTLLDQNNIHVSSFTLNFWYQVKPEHFAIWNKWLIIGDEIPDKLHGVRYDADIVLLDAQQCVRMTDDGAAETKTLARMHQPVVFEDVYVHTLDGASRHPLASWSPAGFQLHHERARILRRVDLKRIRMRVATPIGHYDEERYAGTFAQYVLDNRQPERDSAIRCGYGAAALVLEALNAEEVLVPVQQWSTEVGNTTSMLTKVAGGTAEISGTTMRVWPNRIARLDYVMPIWPFIVGFTYLSERESSSNMFVIPFTGGVWGACAAVALVLALAQWATARTPLEKEGALIAVLATWLQQDASAVPEGLSGRLTFLMVSVCSMLVYAYYTSAIVSALLSAGGGGPRTLRGLADSRLQLASEDYDWIRYLMFDVETTWDDLEYLKRKKMTSNFYQSTERGMQLVMEGNTAFHAEYNHIYPLLNMFSDNQICKLDYVDTVPEVMSWMVATKRGQWTDVLRSTGGWIHETGLAKRLVSRWQLKPPPCRAALLAERVKYGDVAPLIILSIVGLLTSVALVFVERFVARWTRKNVGSPGGGDTEIMEEELID